MGVMPTNYACTHLFPCTCTCTYTCTCICVGVTELYYIHLYFLSPAGGFLPYQIPLVYQSGFLLKRDDKYRWHRYWCKVDGKDMEFFVYGDSNEETLIKRFPLKTVTSLFGPPQTTECDKENCFILSGILEKGGDIGSSEEIYLAAYSDADYQQWRTALSLLTGTRESMRMSSASFLDGSQWAAMATGNDGASTSSSNFSSNRESMVSTTSSLPYVLRPPSHDSPPRGRSPLEQGVSAMDTSTLSTKQQQPLPSPPHEVHVLVYACTCVVHIHLSEQQNPPSQNFLAKYHTSCHVWRTFKDIEPWDAH